ncbi:MAG: hypothetical protein CMI09_03270 [Oceanospirillaceae bacterium]|nr:hypothetical protein [Oceanospirillaceae bacterium]|tara:strand:- start:3429 stop:4367 length:939 start_codon:yes stop_codon:yes gene_type:complete
MADFIPATTQGNDEAKLDEQRKALNAYYESSKTAEATKELAATLKYQGSLNPDSLEDGVRESQARIGAEIFQIGTRLLLLKEQCQHGEFSERLDRLGFSNRVAQRFMQVTMRFSNASLKTHLQNLGKTKLLEMLVLDDEEIEELAEEGSVRGLELDEIDRMPVSELRKKLREEKNKVEAQDKLITTKNETIDTLLTEAGQKPAELATPDEELAKLHAKAAALSHQVSNTVLTELRSLIVQIVDHHSVNGGDSTQILNGYMSQITSEVGEVRQIFGGLEDTAQEWQTWNDENPINPVDENQLDMLEDQPQVEA